MEEREGWPKRAERGGQLDPQSLVVQSIRVLIGSPPLIAGKLPWSFCRLRPQTNMKLVPVSLEELSNIKYSIALAPHERYATLGGTDSASAIGVAKSQEVV
ncbi:MAG: hypothetical protein U0941_21105 [Planctomycetaceae bacterium]